MAQSLPRQVKLSNPIAFEAVDERPVQGTVDVDCMHITKALLDDKDLELEVFCANDPSKTATTSRYSRKVPCIISITIYGPLEAFTEVGTFFQDENIYLQDPIHTERHVRYLNPHRLSSLYTDTPIWTSDVKDSQNKLFDLKEVRVESATLDIFESNEDLAETPQPNRILTPLKR